jgi:CHAD domain-containing protein
MTNGDLISADRPPLEAVQAALRAWFRTERAQPRITLRDYYDTFDRRVRKAGKVVWLERSAYMIADVEGPEAPQQAHADVIQELAGVRALLRLTELETHTETLNVLDGLDKTIARVHIDSPVVLGTESGGVPLTARIRVTGLRGYDRELGKVRELLERSEDLVPAQEPLLDAAARVSGAAVEKAETSIVVEMRAQERGDVVSARVLKRLLTVMQLTLPGTIANTDVEFLHDYRVSVRRTRSVLKEMPGVFSPDDLAYAKTEFRWLQQITGETRDLDVWMMQFDRLAERVPDDMRSHLAPVKRVLELRHAEARAVMETQLQTTRAEELHDWWGGLLEVLVLDDESERPDAAVPISRLAAHRIRKVHRKMVTMGRTIDPDSDPHEYHQLRKRGKELRYLLELFGARLYDPEVVKPMIKALKGLQDVLGRHQDRDVQVHTLKELGPAVIHEPDGAAALMALGVLVERLESDAAQARSEFSASFDAFSSSEQIKLVKHTFRA